MTNWKSYVNSHIKFPCTYEYIYFFYCDLCSRYHILHADSDSDKYLDNVVAGWKWFLAKIWLNFVEFVGEALIND